MTSSWRCRDGVLWGSKFWWWNRRCLEMCRDGCANATTLWMNWANIGIDWERLKDWTLGWELRQVTALLKLWVRPAIGLHSFGSPVNLAARLQSMAPNNEILVSEPTMRLLDGDVEFLPFDEITPSFSRPIKVYGSKIFTLRHIETVASDSLIRARISK